MKWNKLWILEIAIIFTSFFIFSNAYSPAVSSDDALSVLMTADYSFPEAIYCWGQDRGGTIVPLIGQFFLKVFGLSSVWAEGLARYIILALGFLSFRRFFKSGSSKIALAIIFFLPPHYFNGFTVYSWGLMYSFIGLCVWFVELYKKYPNNFQNSLAFGALLMAFIAIWTMDQAIVPLCIFLAYLFYTELQKNRSLKWILQSKGFFTSLIGSIFILLFIKNLKKKAIVSDWYSYSTKAFNSFDEIIKTLSILIDSIKSELLFNGAYAIGTFYYWFLFISVFIGLYLLIRNPKKEYLFILLTALAILAMLLCSNWVLSNHVSRRYFSGLYFVWSLLFFLLFDNQAKKKKVFNLFLPIILLIGSINTIIHYASVHDGELKSRYKELAPIEDLGEIGIIGDYWYSYGISFRNPNLIIATPHEGNEAKNRKFIEKVFKQPKIYLVKELWLEEFPTEITQFGRKLQKVGSEISIANLTLCEYKLI